MYTYIHICNKFVMYTCIHVYTYVIHLFLKPIGLHKMLYRILLYIYMLLLLLLLFLFCGVLSSHPG